MIKQAMPNIPKKFDYRSSQYKFHEKQIFKPSVDCSKLNWYISTI